MSWFKRIRVEHTSLHEDHAESDYLDRVEKVTDLSTRLEQHRKKNGFGKMFDTALKAPRQEGRHP